MVNALFHSYFQRVYSKIKDRILKQKIKKQVRNIINNPKVGKPMRFIRKGTREVYIAQFRLSYEYIEKEGKIIFLDLYHKDEQ